MKGILNIVIGLVFVAGGLSGQLALAGTESSMALVGLGVLIILWGVGRALLESEAGDYAGIEVGTDVQHENDLDEERPLYTPAPGEAQLTVRAVLTGCLLGGIVCAMNIYFGLQTGWTIGGSLISAILAFSFFSVFANLTGQTPLSRLEVNIAQTAGSAAGSMTSAAGLLSAIPAMSMLGYKLSYFELTLWATSVAWLGVFYAVPLRTQMVLVEKLRFPTGTATAETIISMFSEGAEAVKKSRYLINFGLMAAAFQLVNHFFPFISHPTITAVVPESFLPMLAIVMLPAAYSFSLYCSPLMWGAGILIGQRIALSLLLGAVVAWGVLIPSVEWMGWVPTMVDEKSVRMSYEHGARGWILWPGVAIMVADALTSLALSWRTILNTFRTTSDTTVVEDTSDDMIPNSWWIGGLAIASLLTVVTSKYLFDIHPLMTLLAVALSSVLAAIATRSTGETDINPTGGMGKVTQLVYGGIAPGQIQTNLMSAAITSAGASQAGDMMQDLKTGWLLGASPRKQLIAQLAGVTAGILISVPTYLLFDEAFDIGGMGKTNAAGVPLREMPAPAAHAWASMARVLSQGTDALPENALSAVVVALVIGALIPISKKVLNNPWWLPSGLAIGLAFIVPASYSLAMVMGMAAHQMWVRADKQSAASLSFAVASGLIAGEGLMGVGTGILEWLEYDGAWLIGLFF